MALANKEATQYLVSADVQDCDLLTWMVIFVRFCSVCYLTLPFPMIRQTSIRSCFISVILLLARRRCVFVSVSHIPFRPLWPHVCTNKPLAVSLTSLLFSKYLSQRCEDNSTELCRFRRRILDISKYKSEIWMSLNILTHKRQIYKDKRKPES